MGAALWDYVGGKGYPHNVGIRAHYRLKFSEYLSQVTRKAPAKIQNGKHFQREYIHTLPAQLGGVYRYVTMGII